MKRIYVKMRYPGNTMSQNNQQNAYAFENIYIV